LSGINRALENGWITVWRAAKLSCKGLHSGPVALAANWLQLVKESQTEAEWGAMRRSLARGRPYGSDGWMYTVPSLVPTQILWKSVICIRRF
jgi:hypothetical protein